VDLSEDVDLPSSD